MTAPSEVVLIKRACDAALQENWQNVELIQRIEQIMNDVLAQNLEEAKSKAAKAIANTLKGKSVEDTKARDMANAILSALGGIKKYYGNSEGGNGSGQEKKQRLLRERLK